MARILIIGKGGYGDMFPLFAIAQALIQTGHGVTVAAESHHAPACASINVQLVSIDSPSPPGDIAKGEGAFKWQQNIGEFFRTLSPASLEGEFERLTDLVRDADLVVGNQLAYAGAIAAKKWNKPWIFCAASPLAIASYQNPPLFPYLHGLQQLARRYGMPERQLVGLARYASALVMHANVKLQRRLNIADGGHPRFESMYSRWLNLLCVSPTLVTPQPDWPANTVLTGFTWFEPRFMRDPNDLARLAAFLDAGDPPVVIAPGGSRRTQPGDFFDACLTACKQLGLRTVVVASKRFHDQIPQSPQVLISGYVPYSSLFGQAAALIHSAGIGTIGWSIKHALASLLVPTDWDQFDNADRAQRHNLAVTLGLRHLRAPAIAKALDVLLRDSTMQSELAEASLAVSREDGVAIALAEIENVLAFH